MAITDYKNKDTEKKDIKKASTEDIINLITTEYYTKKIEELETQLFNVRCGNPIYENGPIYTGEEKMCPSGRGFSSVFARKRGFEREADRKTIVF